MAISRKNNGQLHTMKGGIWYYLSLVSCLVKLANNISMKI